AGKPITPYDANRPPNASGQGAPGLTPASAADPNAADPNAPPEEKKKNPLQKIFGIFGGKKKDPDKAKPKPEKGDSP
ncbi:MAG: hypothetical protein WBW58_06735, partial [Candidatus Acidiferrum sp.]